MRITPKASCNAIGEVIALPDGRCALAVRIAAPPVDAAANAELLAFVARTTGVPRRSVTIRSGKTGRLKIVQLDGDVRAIVAVLRAATSPA